MPDYNWARTHDYREKGVCRYRRGGPVCILGRLVINHWGLLFLAGRLSFTLGKLAAVLLLRLFFVFSGLFFLLRWLLSIPGRIFFLPWWLIFFVAGLISFLLPFAIMSNLLAAEHRINDLIFIISEISPVNSTDDETKAENRLFLYIYIWCALALDVPANHQKIGPDQRPPYLFHQEISPFMECTLG